MSVTLLLWLEAPLQSWGVDSRFGRRDTLPFPSKSAIMGLLCSASGRGGEQEDWLKRMEKSKQNIIAYSRKDYTDKAQCLPLLCDFHMVGSGYDSKDPWQNMCIPKTSNGKKPTGAGTKITYRYYIQDMAFACILTVPSDMAEELAYDLSYPVWDLSLGRKCCIPTDFIYRGSYTNIQEAHEEAKNIAVEKNRLELFQVLDGVVENGEVITVNDVPLCFGIQKKYKDRQITIVQS